jgi:hypothetical protein
LQDDEVRRLEDVIRRFRRLQVRDAIRRSRLREAMELIGPYVILFVAMLVYVWLFFSFIFLLGATPLGAYINTLLLYTVSGSLLPPCNARFKPQDANRFGRIGSHI